MLRMKLPRACAAAVLVLLLAGCGTRSISNSEYWADSDHGGWRGGTSRSYRGELSEFDVLGIKRDKSITEDDIRKALEAHQPLMVRKGSSIMLVQSGAQFADDGMVRAMGKYYAVTSFGGVPDAEPASSPVPAARSVEASYSTALRLAAARGGCDTIIAYWGVLETGHQDLATKTVSWVPIVGWQLPDEKQHMRMRLKIAVVDVKTGAWEMFSPEPMGNDALSGILSRENSDQKQVETLKIATYNVVAEDFAKRYTR